MYPHFEGKGEAAGFSRVFSEALGRGCAILTCQPTGGRRSLQGRLANGSGLVPLLS